MASKSYQSTGAAVNHRTTQRSAARLHVNGADVVAGQRASGLLAEASSDAGGKHLPEASTGSRRGRRAAGPKSKESAPNLLVLGVGGAWKPQAELPAMPDRSASPVAPPAPAVSSGKGMAANARSSILAAKAIVRGAAKGSPHPPPADIPSRPPQVGPEQQVAAAASPRTDSSLPSVGQRQEVFTTELLVGPNGEVTRTRIRHLLSGDEQTWQGWRPEWMADFVTSRANVRPGGSGPVAHPDRIPAHQLQVLVRGGSHSRLIPRDQPFEVRLTLDLGAIPDAGQHAFDYEMVVQAVSARGRERSSFGTLTGRIDPGKASIAVAGLRLPAGIYQLEAAVSLRHLGASGPPIPPLSVRGGCVQVY